MNYEKAEKRLSDMKEKDILNDNDYEFLAEIAKSDDMCLSLIHISEPTRP